MKPALPCAILVLLFLVQARAQPEDKRAMTTDDGLDMKRVEEATMSPDGKWVLYRQSEKNWDEKKRKTTYYMVSTDGGTPFQYIGKEGANAPRFSPTGEYLAFTRKVDKKDQIFLMRTNGGEAVQLTKHKAGLRTYRWGPDSDRLYFLAPKAKSKHEEKLIEDGYDAIFVDEGPNGQQSGSWNTLWEFNLDNKEETKLIDDESIIREFELSPNGEKVLYTARQENRRNQSNLSEVYLFTRADSVKTRLTNNHAAENNIAWAPDGESFLYSAPDDENWELRTNKLWLMNIDTREHRMISSAFEGAISRAVWTPDGESTLFNGRHKTQQNLYKLNIKSGNVKKITDLHGGLRVASYSRDRSKMVYTFEDLDRPRDLYASPTSKLEETRLTELNSWIAAEIALAKGEVIRWKSKDGLEIEGILLLPQGYAKGTRLPLVLHVHGGPAGAFTETFRANYHVWAGLGYAQLLPNVRGSSGYGDDFLRGNMHDIGGGDYWDLMTGVDHVITEGYVDEDRMGIRGWSYGGILGGWTITQTDRFRAASLGAMVSDWTSEYGPGFNYDVRLWYIGGTPWENAEGYRQRSALTHTQNIATPTLILHGMNDRTDTEPQSMMFFSALKDQGKTARYVRFPREPHGFREQRHQRRRDIEEIKWMQKHVLGIDWTPWELEADKPKDDDKATEKKEIEITSSRQRKSQNP